MVGLPWKKIVEDYGKMFDIQGDPIAGYSAYDLRFRMVNKDGVVHFVQRTLIASDVIKIVWSAGTLDDDGFDFSTRKQLISHPELGEFKCFKEGKSYYLKAELIPFDSIAFKCVAGVEETSAEEDIPVDLPDLIEVEEEQV